MLCRSTFLRRVSSHNVVGQSTDMVVSPCYARILQVKLLNTSRFEQVDP